jgi:hypothetical protein
MLERPHRAITVRHTTTSHSFFTGDVCPALAPPPFYLQVMLMLLPMPLFVAAAA